MTLRKKILLGYGLAFATLGIVMVWAVLKIVTLGDASAEILKDNYKSIIAANEMRRIIAGETAHLLSTKPYTEQQRLLHEGAFSESLGKARDNITIEGEELVIDSIRQAFMRYQMLVAAYIGAASVPEKRERITPGVLAADDSLNVCLSRLHALNEEAMYRASVNAERVSDGAQFSTIVIGLASLLLGVVFSLYLSNKLLQPLRELARGAKDISEGRYGVDIPVTTGDELGALTHEFNAMAKKLAEYNTVIVDQIVTAQQKSDAILSSIDDGVIVVDTSMRIVDFNLKVSSLLKLDKPQVYKRKLIEEVLHDLPVIEQIRQVLDTGLPSSRLEDHRIIVIRHGQKQIECSITPMLGNKEEILGVVILLRDITRYKELEQLKTDFVMAASHELRTPLTGIGMSIDLLRESASAALEPRERELLTAAHEEVERLKSLVNDLLDLSKIEAGRIDLYIGNVPVQLLADRITGVFSEQMSQNGLNFKCEIPPSLPNVRADANKIIWVVTNLVSNAMRYVERGGTISVSAKQHGMNIYISVSDTGKGIPQEYQTKIFEKFVQLDGMSNHGSGLGLAICKEMVRAHGGTIWVDSEPGQGSTFTFTIPVA